MRRAGHHASAAYEDASGIVSNAARMIVVISCLAAIGAMVYGLLGPRQADSDPSMSTPSPFPATAASLGGPPSSTSPVTVVPSASSSAFSTPEPVRIGLIIGHWEHDSGAVCEDGLTEVEINYAVAQRVADALWALGYQVDLLGEYDPRLEGYQAAALISIHTDSCEDFADATPPATGFKVARAEDSAVLEEEDRLVTCLAQRYAARTGMYYHANSITEDMTRYHAFYDIASQTPAVIIELGFMKRDRQMLTLQTDRVAQGIVDGIMCFVEGGP